MINESLIFFHESYHKINELLVTQLFKRVFSCHVTKQLLLHFSTYRRLPQYIDYAIGQCSEKFQLAHGVNVKGKKLQNSRKISFLMKWQITFLKENKRAIFRKLYLFFKYIRFQANCSPHFTWWCYPNRRFPIKKYM